MMKYRMEQSSAGTTMVADQFDGEWVQATDSDVRVSKCQSALETLLDAIDSVQNWSGTRVGQAIEDARKVVDCQDF